MPTADNDRCYAMCTMPGTVCTRDCCVTLLGWAGRPLGRSVAVGMAYTRPMPCETKQPKPGTINIWQRGPSCKILTCLWQSHITHSQTNLHTSGVKRVLGHTVRGLGANCGQSYQPLHPQSPLSKGKEGHFTQSDKCWF